MENATCPTIVFCLEKTGIAIGHRLAERLREDSLTPPLSIWGVSTGDNALAVTPIYGVPDDPPAPIRPGSVAHIVLSVLNRVFSLGDVRLPAMMEHPVGLRLSLLGATDEAAGALVQAFSSSFHSAAKQHLCGPYLTEACFVLPHDLGSSPADENAEVEQELLRLARSCSDGQNSSENSFAYWWWLGNVNASGLALSPPPTSLDDIAVVINGLLATPPEHLPVSLGMFEGRPQQMSAGYAELFVPSKQVAKYLTARNTCRIIQDLFLDREDCADREAIRRRAWAFASSAECQRALEQVSHTPGGERIWPGFHPIIPDEVMEGDVDDFLLIMHESLHQFVSTEVKQLLAAIARSGDHSRKNLLDSIDAEVQDIANHAQGGLFDALVFLAELAAFLLDATELSETERALNLQELRRRFDRSLAQELHLKDIPHSSAHESAVQQLRQELSQVRRLRNISAPPALDPTILEAVRWSDDETNLSLEQRSEELTRQIYEEINLWAQEVAANERKFLQSRRDSAPEQVLREKNIADCENTLRQSARECKELLFELSHPPKTSWWRIFSSRQKQVLKEQNKRLGNLQRVLLRRHAREVVMAFASRMQLSVDSGLYATRDSILQDALRHVRTLHQKISGAICALKSLQEQLALAVFPTSRHVLRKLLITPPDLEHIFERLRQKDHEVEMAMSLSAWDICCQPHEKTAGQLRKLAGEPFRAILRWQIDDFMRLIKRSDARLETLVKWLESASRPLTPASPVAGPDYPVVRISTNSEFSRMLHSRFWGAGWIDTPELPAATVIQVRELSEAELSALGSRMRKLTPTSVESCSDVA